MARQVPDAPVSSPVRDRIAQVLAIHWRQETGMSYGSPDRCACGVQTLPDFGDTDVSERRALAFAEHQAQMLAEAGVR